MLFKNKLKMNEEIIEEMFDLTELARGMGKKWRLDRLERGTFSFLMNDLFNDSSSFLNYIRMKPETFNFILSKIENDLKRQDTLIRKSVTPAEKLAATLRYVATGESYKSTNYQTRLSESLLCGAIPEVCNAIWKHFKDEFLKFPATKFYWQNIANNFAIKWQFPNCLGALDGKHITFQALRKDGSFFYNYKGTNSIVLLAPGDADCRFICIDVGCNGRTHDAGVLLQSDLKNIVDNAETYFHEDKVIGNGRRLPFVIIGDDAFPLQRHIMKPYSSNTTIKEKQIFNLRLSRARQVVERAIGIMATRFRIFQNNLNLSVEKVELITKTCCILHNLLCVKNNNYLNEPLDTGCNSSTPFTTGTEKNSGKGAAQSIRQAFEEYFYNEGKLNWQENKL